MLTCSVISSVGCRCYVGDLLDCLLVLRGATPGARVVAANGLVLAVRLDPFVPGNKPALAAWRDNAAVYDAHPELVAEYWGGRDREQRPPKMQGKRTGWPNRKQSRHGGAKEKQ